MTQSSDASKAFLQEFFGDGNAIRWEDYESGATNDPVRASLEPWVLRFQRQQRPFLLPRVHPDSKLTAWYVLCTDPREVRSMRESLWAFIGPTYAGFKGELATLDSTDPIDRLCEKTFGSFVYRLCVNNPNDRMQVGKLLSKLVEFRDRESTRSPATIKPIGRLLRDLEMAILAKSEQSAWTVYSEIRNRGRLSAANLAFLQIRIFSAFQRWTDLLQLPNLSDLLQVRRPKRISEQIAHAVYQHYFLKHENAGAAGTAVELCRSIGSRFQNLLRSTEGLQSRDAIMFALVAALASEPPKRDLAELISRNPAISADAAWANALLATLPAVKNAQVVAEATTEYDVADARYNENKFDEALGLYLRLPHTQRSLCRVLETAVEVDTLKSAEDALAYLSAAPDDIRGQVLGRRVCANHIEFLSRILGKVAECESTKVSSLAEWLEFIDGGESLEGAGKMLEYGIKDWMLGSSFDASAIAQKLRKHRNGRPAEIVRNAVPTFLRAMLVDFTPSRELKPVYIALTELLIYDEAIGADDLAAVERLIEAILTTAPSSLDGKNDFAFAAEITVDLWNLIAAPRYFDWVLSMLDLLIDTGGHQQANLAPILAAIAHSSRAWCRRISNDQWSLLELLASDLNLLELISGLRPKPDEASEESKPNIRGLLAGKSIAVYSLTERIARRFGQLAAQAFDGIRIHYVHDKSLTDRMKSLARTADIFIINTWDAKHAATNGIKDNRSDVSTTLEPKGKSATSLMETLSQHAVDLI